MGIIVAIILGGIVGALAARLMGRDTGIIMSIIIGVLGSFIGSWLSMLFTGSDRAFPAFSWVGLFWSFMGALILVFIVNMLSRPHHTQV
ncbi:GlsB/YeaQ/YmgE family stress response membrane protein [Candidatus Saccharibacteria bacterium]|nr:GlsB/YeaQ/YmgE family stress response membrane protein [Candidatus Saccharibacteria bacterium]